MPQPAIRASIRAMTMRSGERWAALAARSLPQNSATGASSWRPGRKLLTLGKRLSSMETPAIPAAS